MLILSRGVDDVVTILCRGITIEVMVTSFSHGRAALGFKAPDEVMIVRKELIPPQRSIGGTDRE